ncbi:MAG: adenylate kinase [Spirochaetaceae bacterium]|nr:adenylate kinase [Spirochaetaceae bacterium]
MNFIFLGPPGAGKGTLAFEVAKSASIPHISTGDIFRQAIRDKTELGLKVKAIIDSGALVSDEITTALVAERLKADDCKNGFILDGFPRTIPQAEALAQLVTIDKAINFDISDEEVIKRLSGRRTCTSCGKVYNIVSMPPKQENCCDACGAALITRDDDKPESIKKRLEAYRNQTAPVIDFYRNAHIICDIDARPPSGQILDEFKKLFSI